MAKDADEILENVVLLIGLLDEDGLEEVQNLPFLEMAKDVSVKIPSRPRTTRPKKFTKREVGERAERCEVEEYGLRGLQRRMNGEKKRKEVPIE